METKSMNSVTFIDSQKESNSQKQVKLLHSLATIMAKKQEASSCN